MSTTYRIMRGQVTYSALKQPPAPLELHELHPEKSAFVLRMQSERCWNDEADVPVALRDKKFEYLWVYRDKQEKLPSFERYGANDVERMLQIIANHFDLDIEDDLGLELIVGKK